MRKQHTSGVPLGSTEQASQPLCARKVREATTATVSLSERLRVTVSWVRDSVMYRYVLEIDPNKHLGS